VGKNGFSLTERNIGVHAGRFRGSFVRVIPSSSLVIYVLPLCSDSTADGAASSHAWRILIAVLFSPSVALIRPAGHPLDPGILMSRILTHNQLSQAQLSPSLALSLLFALSPGIRASAPPHLVLPIPILLSLKQFLSTKPTPNGG
jgi:hypothetical protein